MKLKKALVGLACLTTVFTLVACKGKTTKKATTSSKTTTNIVSTTKKETTKKQTTAATTTKSQIPSKYAVTKEVFDSYFNPASFEAALAFNGTISVTSAALGYGEMTVLIETDGNKILETGVEDHYRLTSIEDGKAIVHKYTKSGSEWKEQASSPETITDINTFAYINSAMPCGFDFDKLSFNFETNSYESDETIEYTLAQVDHTYTYKASNFVVKFEDNKPVSISLNVTQTTSGSEIAMVMSMSMTISKLGETTVDDIVIGGELS